MFVPLDHLYHWISGITPQPANIYYFYPHGSKNLENCIVYPPGQTTADCLLRRDNVNVFCFDQEPLNFDYYDKITTDSIFLTRNLDQSHVSWHIRDRDLVNIDAVIDMMVSSVYDTTILIHSEKHSQDVVKYQQAGYLPVHYWSHGLIARDWFRFALCDNRLDSEPKNNYDFLIYSRDWSGTREYRLKFLELLIAANLADKSRCYFNSISDTAGYHYTKHHFANQQFQIHSDHLQNYLAPSQVSSNASADYDALDHLNTSISVVLETQFDNDKIHLTEKICRALACGHPFILAAGPGSLEYVRSYGFETYADWIDESYDTEPDSVSRLEKIIKSMKKFSCLSELEKANSLTQMKAVAMRNKQRFFSQEFYLQLASELKTGLSKAFDQALSTKSKKWLSKKQKMNHLLQHRPIACSDALTSHLKLIFNDDAIPGVR